MKRVKTSVNPEKKVRPALNPEAEEDQMIALTFDLVKQRLIDGTASSQETTHFLKVAYSREKDRLELEKIKEENKLLRAKTQAIEDERKTNETYVKAIEAMLHYQGRDEDFEDYVSLEDN